MMHTASEKPARPLTGWHVLAISVAFFGVIIGVNVYMAAQAIGTFPGLEVENSYVASQTFDAERSAQQALGWNLAHSYDGESGELVLAFTDRDGIAVEVRDLTVLLGRTTEAAEDRQPDFAWLGGEYRATEALNPGKWMMHVEAHAQDGTLFRQRLDLFVKD